MVQLRLCWKPSLGVFELTVNPSAQTETTTARRATFLSQHWQILTLGAFTVWLYWTTLVRLVLNWRNDEDFSHGFFVPLFSAFVIWQERDRLARIIRRPSWSGAALIVGGLGLLIFGRMGVELFTERTSLLFVLAGLVVLLAGWSVFRAVFFPWAFLFLMIPVPKIIFNQITFPLQILASKIAAATLPYFGVPVLRQGNVIVLSSQVLQVAEACSGIRSLMSLVTLAIIYGYFMEKRLWLRYLLALASVPIAVAANSFRIISTGLMVQYWDPEKAEGYFHTSWGWIVFVVSLFMLYALHGVIRWIWADEDAPPPERREPTDWGRVRQEPIANSSSRFIVAALLIASTAAYLQAHNWQEVYPPRTSLQSFPTQLATRVSTEIPIEKDQLEVLGNGEFLHRQYDDQQQGQPWIDLFIAYYKSQSAGETPHSPQNCLPGSGWTPIENTRIALSVPGHAPFPVNRYIIVKGDARELVLYWFWAHNHGVASEYWNKYYLVKDSIKLHRSDGSLIRIVSPMEPGESIDAAQQRITPFVDTVLPMLDDYIPR